MTKTGIGMRRKVFAAILVVAVALAFSPLAATTAHAASKFTIYKGQKIDVKFYASNKVSFKSSKTKVIKIKKGSDNTFTIVARKTGKATLTAKAKYYKTKKFTVTVKKSYPAGSIKKPITVGSKWVTIKSLDGKKVIKAKSTVLKGEAARQFVNAKEGGGTVFDNYYYTPETAAGKTLYVIQYDYKIVKGYPAGKGAYLSGALGSLIYDKNWKQLSSSTDYTRYPITGLASSSGESPNGTSGTYYLAIFVKSGIKELRSDYVGNMRDPQKLGTFGNNYDLIVSGCVRTVLP